jgi:hypothetical protein
VLIAATHRYITLCYDIARNVPVLPVVKSIVAISLGDVLKKLKDPVLLNVPALWSKQS